MPPSHYDPTSPAEQPVALPAAPRVALAPNAVLQPPLSRRGRGPGLVVFLPPEDALAPRRTAAAAAAAEVPKPLDPEPVQKWAEEGFAVVGVTIGGGSGGEESWSVGDALDKGVQSLRGRQEVDTLDKLGIIIYDPAIVDSVLGLAAAHPLVVCAVSYGAAPTTTATTAANNNGTCPVLSHVPGTAGNGGGGTKAPGNDGSIVHAYPTAASPFFVLPHAGAGDYHAPSAGVAHTRSLVFLRTHVGGPHFDLEAIWEEHTFYEFTERSLAKTMGTMVAEPYVNHVPTMTGGMGRENLTAFYRDHFIFSNPTDTAFEPVSRTIGADRIIDEFIFTGTHDKVIDWLLPGVPPSGKKLAIPVVCVVNVRGDRLYHEHIWWDQATVLLQAGLIPTHVPHPLPDGAKMLRLPVAGAESARLLADEAAGGSNRMFGTDWGLVDM